MKHLGSTWVGSCIGATLGSLYAGFIVATITAKSEWFTVFCAVVALGIIISLPMLFAGSIVVGQFLSRFLVRCADRFRVAIFGSIGALLGIICFLIFCLALGVDPLELLELPSGVSALETLSIPSIFVVYLTAAGLVTALHINKCEQDAALSSQ